MKRLHRSIFAVVAFAAGCSNKEFAPPPSADDSATFDTESTVDSTTTTDSELTDSGSLSDGSTGDSSAGDGSTDGASTDGASTDGASSDATSDSVSTDVAPIDAGPPATCAKSYSDVTPTPLVYPGPHDGALLSAITWDELTMVWTTTAAGKVTVHVADRATRDASFISDFPLPDSLGPFAEDKVALYADGKTMFFVSADHKTIKQLTRSARGVAFDASSATSAPFSVITGTGGEGGATKQLADLTLSKDGKWLFYTDLLVTSGASMRLSVQLADGTWDAPNVITASRLAMDGALRCRPTGLSGDKRTLFFFDESFGATFVAFRPADSVSFTEFYGYSPSGSRAMPADACDRVYLDIGTHPDIPDGGFDGAVPTTKAIYHAP